MKRSRIVGVAILIIMVVALALNYTIIRGTFAGLQRGDFGFWLTGDVVTAPVTDWSFTDTVPNVQLETRTWYFIPHFVRTDIARSGAQLYLFSEYFAPAPGQADLRDHFPEARFWNRMVLRDPRIRVKIGNRVFQMRAYPLTDRAEMEVAHKEFRNKYAEVRENQAWPESRRPKLYFFRLEQRWNDRP